MKQKYIYLFLIILSAVFSCVQFDEDQIIDDKGLVEMIPMSFNAVIDTNEGDTKTVLDGQLGDSTRKVLWQPNDAIGIVGVRTTGKYESAEKFSSKISENSSSASFEGAIPFASEYHAFYPYQETLRDSSGFFVFDMPQVQKYVDGSFDPNSAPMVAKAKADETLTFKNVCGLLALRLSGTGTVKNIIFNGFDESGKPVPTSGVFAVQYSDNPLIQAKKGNSSVTLDCGEGIALDGENSKPFYFVLPPAVYNRFVVIITTTDGDVMMREGTKPLTIKRSDVQPTSALKYAETAWINLSETGHSNCYLVTKPGLYTFDADVMGIGKYGLVDGAKFHTNNTSISPVKAELLWEDMPGTIVGLSLKDNKISFITTGQEGNALIAAKDSQGNILWSWHIWMTDQPKDQVYVNDKGTYTMLDRNIGAIRADRGTGSQYRESVGAFYQWGRKDPFMQSRYSVLSGPQPVAESVKKPDHVIAGNNQWVSDFDSDLWCMKQKTIYDPCPVGYRVPPVDVWFGFTKRGEGASNVSDINASGSFDNGWNLIYDGANTTWYPATGETGYWGDYTIWDNRGRCWSSCTEGTSPAYLNYYYNSQYDFEFYIQYLEPQYAYSVRCMKDEEHFDISIPEVKTVGVRELSSESAVLVANVENEGISGVIERGFVWGMTPDLSDGIEVECYKGPGEYTLKLSGLEHSTRYYFRSYAVNARGRRDTKISSFYTPYSGTSVDLSAKGTANCYIVPPVYSDYVFNCSVKGNSNESVGTPASAEVLWETRLDYRAISVGSVIESVSLDGNNVKFRLPFDAHPGNALIAVKDASGTILWSWHIWVVDFDPEQTGCKLISGAKVMDRNLGALSVIPEDKGAMTTDYSAYGLYYQWGRKDPFAWDCNVVPTGAIKNFDYDSSYDSIEASVQYPTHCYDEVRWGDDTSLWNYKKTKYDPCPSGWKVTERAVWEGMTDVNFENTADLYLTVSGSYSSPSLIIPYGGFYDYGTNNSRHGFKNWIKLWNSDYRSYLFVSDNMIYLNSDEVDLRLPVRCMKDDPQKPGTGDDYIVDDEYEW